eukprot:scaffold147956_cov37-Prasinocladus_malaysianus.AAC.1
MLQYLWTHLMTCLQKEQEQTVIDCMVEAVKDIIDLMPDMITDEQKTQAFAWDCCLSFSISGIIARALVSWKLRGRNHVVLSDPALFLGHSGH